MEDICKWILLVIGAFWVVGTLLPLSSSGRWWIRDFDFPRVQIVIGAAMTAALLMIFYRETAAAVWMTVALMIAIGYQLYRIFPYTILSSTQTIPSRRNDPSSRLSIVVSNILMTNRSSDRFLAAIREADPDLVLVLEPDDWWADAISELGERYPYSVVHPLPNTYGIILYSKLRLVDPSVEYLVEPDIPSIHAGVELGTGEIVQLYCVHPRPPRPDSDSDKRDAELILVAKMVKKSGLPSIVAGDLNDVAWSRTTDLFQQIASALDPRIGRGFFNTFHAGYFFFRWPLDHLMHTREFRFIDIRRLPNVGSDHFPIYGAVSYEPEREEEQEKPVADHEDQKDAAEILEKA
jgi:endonuclease/exonuclease/phosphatase (EEP) superfamily protein YafD